MCHKISLVTWLQDTQSPSMAPEASLASVALLLCHSKRKPGQCITTSCIFGGHCSQSWLSSNGAAQHKHWAHTETAYFQTGNSGWLWSVSHQFFLSSSDLSDLESGLLSSAEKSTIWASSDLKQIHQSWWKPNKELMWTSCCMHPALVLPLWRRCNNPSKPIWQTYWLWNKVLPFWIRS